MKIREIVEKLNEGKYVIWIDDKQDAKLTPEYMESHFVKIVDSLEEGYEYCTKKQEEERAAKGKSTTRYRVTGLKEDYVCSEDLDPATMEKLVEKQRERKE